MQNRLNEDRIELLQSYVRDVVARDVAERLGREDIRIANQFALYGLRNTACEFSVNQLVESFKELGFKIYWEKADVYKRQASNPLPLFDNNRADDEELAIRLHLETAAAAIGARNLLPSPYIGCLLYTSRCV